MCALCRAFTLNAELAKIKYSISASLRGGET